MVLIFEVLLGIYSLLVLLFFLKWVGIDLGKSNAAYSNSFITAIIPVRNEGENIEKLLWSFENQTLDKAKFEVIVVNDHSTDDTEALVLAFAQKSKLNLKLIHLENADGSPKKRALTQAIAESKGNIIFTTDGDCEFSEGLLLKYVQIFGDSNVKFISGPVTFFREKVGFWALLWERVQTVEFASLLGSAAASLALGSPNMCSGANLAYRKETFYELNGYEGNLNIASGDDEFLMHKFSAAYPKSLVYAKDAVCIVQTGACETPKVFYKQRKRWASKWNQYNSILPTLLAVFIFLSNVGMLVLIYENAYLFVAVRVGIEIFFLGSVLRFLRRKDAIIFIPLVQIIYPFYVMFFGLVSIFAPKAYDWKGRKLK
jgi:cellulose synthase/poly-beta-1,6-N-acetylglucosamine synthase-like glycosyltransferase